MSKAYAVGIENTYTLFDSTGDELCIIRFNEDVYAFLEDSGAKERILAKIANELENEIDFVRKVEGGYFDWTDGDDG